MKKSLSLILSVVMIFIALTTCLPVAFAADYVGDCGTGVIWNLDTYTGELVISGSGEMKNYTADDVPTWSAYQNYIKSVTFADGVTSVGEYAFYNITGYRYSKLTQITFGSTVKKIGKYAFRGCKSISSVSGLSNIQEIDEYAFRSCTGIKSLDLNNSVKKIGFGAFGYCSGLENVSFSSVLETISSSAFEECTALKAVALPSSLKKLGVNAFAKCSSLESVEYSASAITDLAYNVFTSAGSSDGMTVTFSENITTIPSNIFNACVNLTAVNIGSAVTTIGDQAFASSGLKTVDLPSSVKTISTSAFFGCNDLAAFSVAGSNLTFSAGDNGELLNRAKTTLYRYPSGRGVTSYELPSKITVIKEGAFSGDDTLVEVDTQNASYVYSSTFQQCSALKRIYMPKVKTIGTYAFADCDSLVTVSAPCVTSVSSCAFFGCDSLANLNGFTALNQIGQYAFSNCVGLVNLTIPSSVTSIGDFAFNNCNNLSTLTVPSSVLTIGKNAFSFCDNLNSVTLNEGLTTVKDAAFLGCTALLSIKIPASVKTIGGYAFGYNYSNGYKAVSGFKIYCYNSTQGYTYAVNHSKYFSYQIVTDSAGEEIVIPEEPQEPEIIRFSIIRILKNIILYILKAIG